MSTSPIDISLIVIAAHARAVHPVAADRDVRGVDDDALAAARDVAALDRAHALEARVRDVDSLRVRPGDGDRAVADHDLREADVDPVELRAEDANAVELDASRALDVDPVLAADDGQVPDHDARRRGRRCRPDDRARPADERLLARDHERPLVDDRPRAASPSAAGSRSATPLAASRIAAAAATAAAPEASELAAVLRVREPQPREDGVPEHLGEQPRGGEERERRRRAAPRCRPAPASAITSASSSAPERERDPARLVVEDAVVERRTSRATPTPTISAAISTGHQRCSASASTQATTSGAIADEQARVDPSLSACTTCPAPLGRKPCAAYFAPDQRVGGRVRPLRGDARRAASVRSSSVSAGTVQSGASTIQSPWVSSPCSATSCASSGCAPEPAPEAGGADDLRRAVHLRLDAEPRRRPARAARPTRGRAGRTARAASRGSPRARPAPWRGSARSPRREKSGRGTLSGRRSGSRRRTDVTRAPAASALRHSVAAAIPAPTTATSSAYSCGS